MAIAVVDGRVGCGRGRGGGLLKCADSCGHVAFQDFPRSAQNAAAHNRKRHLRLVYPRFWINFPCDFCLPFFSSPLLVLCSFTV